MLFFASFICLLLVTLCLLCRYLNFPVSMLSRLPSSMVKTSQPSLPPIQTMHTSHINNHGRPFFLSSTLLHSLSLTLTHAFFLFFFVFCIISIHPIPSHRPRSLRPLSFITQRIQAFTLFSSPLSSLLSLFSSTVHTTFPLTFPTRIDTLHLLLLSVSLPVLH